MSFKFPESGKRYETPERFRSIAVIGPTYGIRGLSWKSHVIDSLSRLISNLNEGDVPILLLTENHLCYHIAQSILELRETFPLMKVRLVKLKHYHTLYHLVPYEYQDEMVEFGGEQFPEMVKAMGMMEEFEYIPDIISIENLVDEVVELEDRTWSSNFGIGLSTNNVIKYIDENSTDILSVSVYQDRTEQGGNWHLSFRKSGIYMKFSENFENDNEVHVRFEI